MHQEEDEKSMKVKEGKQVMVSARKEKGNNRRGMAGIWFDWIFGFGALLGPVGDLSTTP